MTFYELEKACKKRRLKRNLTVLFLVLGIVGIVSFVLLRGHNKKVESKAAEKVEVKNHKIIEKKEVKKEPKKVIKKEEQNSSKLKESKKITKNVEVKLQIEKEVFLKPIINIPEPKKENIVKEQQKEGEKVKRVEKKEENKTENNIQNGNLIVTETINYNSALKKAESFYKDGNYEEAIKWAKTANIQDPTKPESWILTAKSLYKIGKVQKAVLVLRTYLKYYNDKRVKEVLDEITNNTIK